MNLPEARILRREDHQISREDIDPDALKVLYRLHSRGFRAFLVGGGVRDLLLGRKPKDYDIGTDARPAEVLKLFRNSRVIGRRFPIVHILFPRRKFMEVATFRALEEEDGDAEGEEEERLLEEADRLLRGDSPSGEEDPALRKRRRPSPLEISKRQNYGSPAEDALRRDLTINGLFYDIADFSVIDYVGGLEDLENRIIRSIGDAETRFRDDPVRMIRAARHAARIGFEIEDNTWKAILKHRELISSCNKARLVEEFYRDLLGGASCSTFALMKKAGILSALLPELEIILSDKPEDIAWRRLRILDRKIAEGEEIPSSLGLGVLFAFPMLDHILDLEKQGSRRSDIGRAAYRFLKPMALRLGVSRRDTEQLFLISISQRKMLAFLDGGRIPRFLMHKNYFQEALRLLAIEAEARGIEMPEVQFTSSMGKKRRRRRRRRAN